MINFPSELIIKFFSYLDPNDLLSCSAVCKKWRTLVFSKESLTDKVTLVIRHIGIAKGNCPTAREFYEHTQKNWEQIFVRLILEKNNFSIESFYNNKDWINKALKTDGWILGYLDKQFQKEFESVTIALDNKAIAYRFVDDSLKDNDRLLTTVFKERPAELYNAPVRIQLDPKYVAICKGNDICTPAQKTHLCQVQTALPLLEADGMLLECASKDVQDSENAVTVACEENPKASQFASRRLKGNMGLALLCVRKVPETYFNFTKLWNNRELLQILEEIAPDIYNKALKLQYRA